MQDHKDSFKKVNLISPINIKMNFWQKLGWRIKFILFESWNKDLGVIIFSLKSANKRGAAALTEFLNKNKIIKLNRKNKYFKFKNYTFSYDKDNDKNSIIADLVSIWSEDCLYLKKNFIESSAYFFEGAYENDKVKIKEGDLVIDAGANIGLFSILASQKVGRTGKVFAFEPIEQTRELLAKNILYNKVNNLRLVPFALGSRNTDLELIKSDNLGESSFFCNGNFPKVKVKQTTLDNFVREKQLKKVDFIKADIEGMERDLIRGAKETIIKFKPKIAICIYHRSDDAQIIGELLKSFVSAYNLIATPTKLYAWI